MDLPYHIQKDLVALAGGVGQLPVVVKGPADVGTPHVAAHGDDQVGGGDLVDGLAVLGFLHVDAVDLLHQPHRVLVDLGLGLGACGVKVEPVPGQMAAQSLGDLTAAGVVDAQKGDPLSCHLTSPNLSAAWPPGRP